MPNLFADIPALLADELAEEILRSDCVRIERIVSHGQCSADEFWYDQEQHEWVLLIQGAARLRFEDKVVEMEPGDYVNIPAHNRHRVDWTTPDEKTIWLAIHYA